MASYLPVIEDFMKLEGTSLVNEEAGARRFLFKNRSKYIQKVSEMVVLFEEEQRAKSMVLSFHFQGRML